MAAKPSHVPDELVFPFDIYDPPGLEKGFHEAWKVLQADGVPDLVWTPYNGGHWLVTRGRLLGEVLSNYTTFSSRVIIVPKERGETYHILPTHLSPPVHRPYRQLLNAGLSPKRINAMKGTIHQLIAKLTESVREKGQCNFTTEVAAPFPMTIFMLILGLPVEDGPYLKHHADHVMRPDGTMSISEAEDANKKYLKPYIDERRKNPGDDMISGLVNGTIDDKPLNDEDAFQLCIEVVIAGLDTVVNFMNFILLYLAEHPEQRQLLLDDPALIPAAADEFVRRFGLVVVGRHVEHDVEFHGVQMKAGEMIINGTMLHGLDNQVNEDPMTVNFFRTSVEHTSFGAGPHRCAGAPLARVEIIAALQEWLSRIPHFKVAPGSKVGFKAGTVGCMENLNLVWDPSTTKKIPLPA
jgi:cytochrome P450